LLKISAEQKKKLSCNDEEEQDEEAFSFTAIMKLGSGFSSREREKRKDNFRLALNEGFSFFSPTLRENYFNIIYVFG